MPRKWRNNNFVMTPAPCRVAGCTISVRPTACVRAMVHLLTYLLTYAKRLKIERKLLLTAYIKSYTGFRLPPKCMTLNDLCARYKVTDSLNTAKMAKFSLVMTPTPFRVAGCIISVRRT